MNPITSILATTAAMLALTAPAIAATDDDTEGLRAGAAAADITPPIGTPQFAYTDRSRVFGPDNNADAAEVLADPDTHGYAKTFIPSKGVHMRLKSSSLVIERDGERYAMSQVDLGGIPFDLAKAVAAKVAPLGITQDRLIISATHTHTGSGAIWPNENNLGYGFVGGDIFDKRIFDLTVDGIVESITKAVARLEDAKVGVGTTRLADASRNRASEAFALNRVKPATTNDQQLTVVRVDGTDKKPIAVWSNFAAHPTNIDDPIFSAEYPGSAKRIVEAAIGGGAVNIQTNGNLGDISPDGEPERVGGQAATYTAGGLANSNQTGRKVARGVLRAWEEAGDRLTDDIDIAAAQGYLPFDGTEADGEPVGPYPVLGASIVGGDGLCAPVDDLAGPGQGRKMFGFGVAPIVPNVAPVSIWRIGGLGIITTPSELTWAMGRRIRDAVQASSGGKLDDVITAGMTDGYISYASTPEEYDYCGYEGGFTLYGRQQGARYRDYAVGLTASLLTGAPEPTGAAEPAQLGLGTENDTPLKETPEAGTAVDQPTDVKRYGKAVFRFKGGDRAIDAARGRTFVRVQRRVGSKWKTVATDDSAADVVLREAGDTYVESFQFGDCDPVGTYRFKVTGRALKGGKVREYTLTSKSFEVSPNVLTVDGLTIAGGRATFRGLYPNPGGDAFIALPRLVTSGEATALVDGKRVKASYDRDTALFSVPAPDGATVVPSIEDHCGNASG